MIKSASKNQKGVVHLLLLISAIGIIVFLAFSSLAPLRDQLLSVLYRKPDSFAANSSKVQPKGYIVKFKDKTVSELNVQRQRKSDIKETEADIKKAHLTKKASILNRVKQIKQSRGVTVDSPEQYLTADFTHGFNGLVLDVTEDEANQLKGLDEVQEVYPNLPVKTSLAESIPLINADDVWALKDTLDKNITGQGVNIAIIDTGIDVTHPDLGSSVIQERPVEKVNTTPLLNNAKYVEESIDLDANRVAYPSGSKINIYSFADKTTRTIMLPKPNMIAMRTTIKDDMVVYFAGVTDASATDEGIYLYNLLDNSTKKISNADALASLFLDNGKVIYEGSSSSGPNGFIPHIYIYDITSAQTRQIGPLQDDAVLDFLEYSNGTVVWAIGGSTCINKAVTYDIATEQTQEFVLSDAGIFFRF